MLAKLLLQTQDGTIVNVALTTRGLWPDSARNNSTLYVIRHFLTC